MKRETLVRNVAWIAWLAAAWSGAAFCEAALNVGLAQSDGAYVAVPIEFAPDTAAGASGLQFDLQFDPAQFEIDSVTAGDAAVQGDKDVMWSEPAAGQLRVLVAGMNQTTIPEGTVVSVYLVPMSASNVSEPCGFVAGVASGPYGEDVPLLVPVVNTEEDASNATSDDPAAKTIDDGLASTVTNEIASQQETTETVTSSPAADGDSAEPQRAASYPTSKTAGGFDMSADESEGGTSRGGLHEGGVPGRTAATAPGERVFLSGNRGGERRQSVTNESRPATAGYSQPAAPAVVPGASNDSQRRVGDETATAHRTVLARVLDGDEKFDRPLATVNHPVQNDSPRVVTEPRSENRPLTQAAVFLALVSAMAIVFLVRRRIVEPRPGDRRL